MADQNKVVLPETPTEITIHPGTTCRFCLSETKSGISVNDKCLPEELEEIERDSIYNFMMKLRFVKMEEHRDFPKQVCKNCYKIIQLCYDFSRICEKSDSLLKDYYSNNANQAKETLGKSEMIKNPSILEGHIPDNTEESLVKTLSNFPTVLDEINIIKQTNLEKKLKGSHDIIKVYKRKLNLLSGKTEKAQFQIPEENSKPKLELEHFVYACSQCSLKFTNLRALKFHNVTTHGQKLFVKNKFQHRNCIKSFSDQENLRRHYKAIHKFHEIPEGSLNCMGKETVNGQKFFCFYCVPHMEYESQDQLLQHLEDSHKNEPSEIFPESYACAYCSELNFPTRISLNEHLLSVHKLKQNEMTLNDVKCMSVVKGPQLFVSRSLPAFSSQGVDQKVTELSALLEVLNSVVDSLSLAEQGKGFKVSCRNCSPPPEFTSANDFAQHIRTHHDECKLLENWVIESKPGCWNCPECPATYSRKQTLHCHVREKHKRDLGGTKCPEVDCSESFPTNRQLIQHGINVHQKYFAYFHKVFKKILQPETEEEYARVKNFECDVCQKKYIYKSSLRKHILATHLGKPAKDAAVCPYCGKTISSKLNLKSHIEFVHEAVFVSCPICKKKINFRTIGKHYKTHQTSSDVVCSKNSFLCNLCGKILKSKRSFEDHQKLHKNVREELCDVCGSGFTTKKFLRLHKKTHEGIQRKAFGCDQCDKVFSGRHTLNRHLLTHSGEKNFICEMCSKCFYTLQELNRHVRYHKKEYRFDCQLCEMRFLDKSRFRHHMMRHRNVRPHKCLFCDKMFIVRGKMNLHMATKHNFEVGSTKGVWKDPKTYVPLDDLL